MEKISTIDEFVNFIKANCHAQVRGGEPFEVIGQFKDRPIIKIRPCKNESASNVEVADLSSQIDYLDKPKLVVAVTELTHNQAPFMTKSGDTILVWMLGQPGA